MSADIELNFEICRLKSSATAMWWVNYLDEHNIYTKWN